MKLIAIIFIIGSSCVSAQSNYFGSEGLSYSNTIIHKDPKYPDQEAQSAFEIHLNSPQQETVRNFYTAVKKPHTSYSQYHALQTQQNNKLPIYKNFVVSNNQAPQSSQAFNVGYSVSFTNGPANNQKQIGLPEIITGRNKEDVIKPSSSFRREEFVQNALLSNAKPQLPGTSLSFRIPDTLRTVQPNVLLSQANLTPRTQKQLTELNSGKASTEQNELPNGGISAPSRKALSPSVEIYQSGNLNFSSTNFSGSSKTFDHAKALARSLGFDYSNVINLENIQPTEVNQDYYKEVLNNLRTRKSNNVNTPIKKHSKISSEPEFQYLSPQALTVDTKYMQSAHNNLGGEHHKFNIDTTLQKPILDSTNIVPIKTQITTEPKQEKYNGETIGLQHLPGQNIFIHHSNTDAEDHPKTEQIKNVQEHQFSNIKNPDHQITETFTYNPNSYEDLNDQFKFTRSELKAKIHELNQQLNLWQNPSSAYSFIRAQNVPRNEEPQKSPSYNRAYGMPNNANRMTNDANLYKIPETPRKFTPGDPNKFYKGYQAFRSAHSDSYKQFLKDKENNNLTRYSRTASKLTEDIAIDLKPPPLVAPRLKRMYTTKDYM